MNKGDERTILIYDCRMECIRKITKKDLNLLAPEMFLFVIKLDSDLSKLNDSIKYRYYLKNGINQLDYRTSRIDYEQCLADFETIQKSFLKSAGLSYNDIASVERFWYLTEEEINKYIEEEVE